MSLVSTVSTIRINWGLIRSGFNLNLDSDRRLFIRYSKCSTQICIDSVDNPNAEFSHLIDPQTPVSTNIALNALHALIYSKCSTQICIDSVDNPNAEFSHLIEPQTPVSTVSTVNSTTSIPDECIDSVDNPNAEFSHLIEPQTPVSTVSTVNSTTSIPDECIDSVDNWVHPVFEMFYSNEPCIDSVDNPD